MSEKPDVVIVLHSDETAILRIRIIRKTDSCSTIPGTHSHSAIDIKNGCGIIVSDPHESIVHDAHTLK